MAAVVISIFTHSALANPVVHSGSAKLVIIIDNLGDQKLHGEKVANLPGEVACSILPHGRYSAKIAELCHGQNKTVILNTPMQAKNNYPLGAGGLHGNMSKTEFIKTLTDDMASVPYLQGLDNHMGSSLTAQEEPMNWLMETIKPHGLFFLDNKTSPHSVIEKLAKHHQVPVIDRDIFLDDVRTPEAIHKQFAEALKIAKRYGIVVIVAHPFAVSLNYLQATLPNLAAQGYQLVSIPQALNINIQPISLTAAKASAKTKNIEPVKPIMPRVTNLSVEKTVVMPATPSHKVLPKVIAATSTAIIEVPIIARTNQQPAIEVSVNKDHKVVINTVDSTKTMALKLPNDNQATAIQQSKPDEPSIMDRLLEKFSHFFHKKQNDISPIASPAQTPAVTISAITPASTKEPSAIMPAAKNGKQAQAKHHKQAPTEIKVVNPPAATNLVSPEQATAQASHSLIQTLKDKLCKKYSHFCGHAGGAASTEQLEFNNAPFIDLQGKLHWPTAGSIATHYGAELGESNLKYNGVLIKAPAGQPVHAIYKGRVIFANWLQGLGLLLIIDHGNGYMSLYGHNDALYKKVGDTVMPNDLVAAVGNSGTPGPAGLYFEIRHNGQPINPASWCG